MAETALSAALLLAGWATAKLFSSGPVSTLFFERQPLDRRTTAAIAARIQLVSFIALVLIDFKLQCYNAEIDSNGDGCQTMLQSKASKPIAKDQYLLRPASG